MLYLDHDPPQVHWSTRVRARTRRRARARTHAKKYVKKHRAINPNVETDRRAECLHRRRYRIAHCMHPKWNVTCNDTALGLVFANGNLIGAKNSLVPPDTNNNACYSIGCLTISIKGAWQIHKSSNGITNGQRSCLFVRPFCQKTILNLWLTPGKLPNTQGNGKWWI